MLSDMSDAPEVVTLYEPATAADKLGVSASGLRRLAPIYESVFDELPRTGKGQKDKRARLWPSEAVVRLQVARGLVEVERYRTIKEALEALRDGLTVDVSELAVETPQAAPDEVTQATLQVLIDEMRQLRLEVGELRQLQETRLIEPETIRQLEQLDKLQTAAREAGQSEDGVFVRFARWLEKILKK